MRILVLGGTTEASHLAVALAARQDIGAILSLAGRTRVPATSPLPTRVGGFGGAEGLARYLVQETIDAVVDATHPFAAQISANAAAACRDRGVPLVALSRPPWQPEAGDRWTSFVDLKAAVSYLAALPARPVFLATGRLGLAAFRAAPQHAYLVRTIDPPAPETLPPRASVLLGRGPFALEDEITTLRAHGTALLVSKNSGGAGAGSKLKAARRLAIPVLMIDRPAAPERPVLYDAVSVLAWIDDHRPPS